MPNEPASGPVILNNTPLVALWSLDRLTLLRDLYGEVFISPAVQEEFLAPERTLRQAALSQARGLNNCLWPIPARRLFMLG